MKKIWLFLFLFSPALIRAQYTRHIVQFTDKHGTPYTFSNPAPYLSPKAIERRTRQQISIDSTDLPVSPVYLDSLRQVPNVLLLNTSRWLNQVLIQTNDAAALAKINSFPFVKATREIAPAARPRSNDPLHRKFGSGINANSQPKLTALPVPLQQSVGTNWLEYGSMYDQIHLHEGEYLHNHGFTGKGIIIAVLDAGFSSYKTNPAFDSVRSQNRILGEWDFVANHASVNEDHSHGANCLSIIAANRPGILVGSAPHASFWLFRTENTSSEFPIEEQNWTAAAEFADSAGADMIASSLGYVDFDNPVYDYSYAERDGNTSMITRAADMAASKGIIVVNSAGNTGNVTNEMRFVLCPADGDSVVAVGGTDVDGNIAGLSSWGPNGNGLVKPNIVSVGQGTTYANTAGNPVAGNGTSYAAPNMCGLIACLWQAFPEFTNMEIIEYVQKSAHTYNNPDERFGYGIPNFRKAFEMLANEREAREKAVNLGNQWIKAYPVPSTGNFNVLFKAPATGKAALQLVDIRGSIIETKEQDVVAGQIYVTRFVKATGLSGGIYYIRYNDGANKATLPVLRQ